MTRGSGRGVQVSRAMSRRYFDDLDKYAQSDVVIVGAGCAGGPRCVPCMLVPRTCPACMHALHTYSQAAPEMRTARKPPIDQGALIACALPPTSCRMVG